MNPLAGRCARAGAAQDVRVVRGGGVVRTGRGIRADRDLEGQIRQWPDAFGLGIVEGEPDTVAIPTKKLAT